MTGKTTRFALAVVAAAVLGCGGSPTQPAADPGVLRGLVMIGPICPVEQPGQPCPVPPEAYAARKILVFNATRSRVIATVDINSSGRYQVPLAPGRYVVDINRIGIDSSKDVPREIQITSGAMMDLDIRIDTGIR